MNINILNNNNMKTINHIRRCLSLSLSRIFYIFCMLKYHILLAQLLIYINIHNIFMINIDANIRFFYPLIFSYILLNYKI